MSEAMTVEQAINVVRTINEVVADKSKLSVAFNAALILLNEVERLYDANIIVEGLKEIAENFVALKKERDELREQIALHQAVRERLTEFRQAAEQERDQLRLLVEEIQHAIIYVKPKNGGKAEKSSLAKIKADAVREACKFAAAKALAEGWHTIDSNDLLEYANQIEGAASG